MSFAVPVFSISCSFMYFHWRWVASLRLYKSNEKCVRWWRLAHRRCKFAASIIWHSRNWIRSIFRSSFIFHNFLETSSFGWLHPQPDSRCSFRAEANAQIPREEIRIRWFTERTKAHFHSNLFCSTMLRCGFLWDEHTFLPQALTQSHRKLLSVQIAWVAAAWCYCLLPLFLCICD